MDPTPGSLDRAIEEAVAAFANTVRAMAHRSRLGPSDLDEVFQEMRIRLWHAQERGERIEAMKPSYMYRVAQSAATDVIRRTHHPAEHSLGDAAERQTPWGNPAVCPESRMHESELEEQVKRALADLSETRRVVVQMHLAGYGQQEITELLGWTEGKTRNLLSRGLADLRGGLAARGIGPMVVP